MLFTQLFESDFNKKPLAEAIDDYEDCRYCSGTGEGRWEGSSCTHCRGTGVEPVSQDDDDFEEPDDDVVDLDNDESYYEKHVRTRNLEESVFLREDRIAIYEQWNKVGKRLVEYKLTPQQVQDIFTQVEKASTAAGGNRTMVGRGVDKAAELNAAWEELKGKIQSSRPVKGFDDLYDTAAAKLKTATGGDEGVMKYVNKYREFAKKHPYIQSAVYAALIAAAGLSGAGLGGAGALGLLKMTDRLLQGDKASSALYKGVKTGALAYGASQLAQYFKNPNAAIPQGTPARLPDGSEYIVQKGDTLSQIAQKNGVSVKDLMQANSGQVVPGGEQMTFNQPDQFGDVNAMGDAVPSGTGAEQTYNVRTKLTNPDVLQPGQKLQVPGSLGPTQTYADNVGTAADTWNKIKSGEYSPSEISRNQAAKYNLPGAGEYNPPSGATGSPGSAASSTRAADVASSMAGSNKPTLAAKGDETNYAASKTNPWDKANAKVDAEVAKANADAQAKADAEVAKANAKASAEYSELLRQNPDAPVAYDDNGDLMPGWVDDPEKPGWVKFNAPKLKESTVYLMFDSVVAGQHRLNEGILDTVKSAAGKAVDWAKTKGHNITTKVTLDKLLQAWNKAGKPTDSNEIKTKVLIPAGVAPQVIDSVYASMKIPATASVPAQPAATAQPTATAPVAKSAAQTQPSWANPQSADYVGRREVARRMAAQPAPAAKPAAPQWTSASGTQPSNVKYTMPAAQPTAKTTPAGASNGNKLTSQQYIQRIGAPQLPENAKDSGNKKKDNDDLGSEIKDVALQRAISRAKADFPTAGSGIEALAKDLMRGQEQDQKTFDQIRQTERQQNQMLAQIDKIDREQEQEINDLEDQNSTLSKRLQQLQNVNSQLEKKLAAMSGRKEKRRADKTEPAPEPTADIPVPTVTKAEPSSDAKAKEPEPTTSRAIGRMAKDLTAEPTKSKAIAQVAKSLSPSEPSAAIDQMAQQLQPRQKELGFDEPVTLKGKKFDTSKASDTKYRELTRRLAKDIVSDPNAAQAFKSRSVQDLAGQQEMPVENKASSARIRAVKTPRADGSVETSYELVNAQGVTVKAGMSKDTAQSHLKHYKQKHGQ